MRVWYLIVLNVLALALPASVAFAASCSNDIDRMQARIDAKVEAIAAAGPFVPAGIWSGMGVQPTPFGMAVVEQKMGELSGTKVDAVRAAMARAHAADATGDFKACEKAIGEVRKILNH
jgi:hypothetical protein